jgi:mannose-6-phosphate isomerase-like protein (cupin superfamily)
VVLIFAALAAAQEGNFGKVPYPINNDSNQRKVDMFLGDWHESIPRALHGIVARDILTRGDNFAPPQKAAVLEVINSFSYGTLAPGASTPPWTLDGQQEVFYFLSGAGTVTAAGKTSELHAGVAILIPAGLEFMMKNPGTEPLTMYVISEPIPPSTSIYRFQPRPDILVKDEKAIAEGSPTHWAERVKTLFVAKDGMANLQTVSIVALDPLTIVEPRTYDSNHEEVWAAIEGTSVALMGTQLRVQPPGVAYMLRPDTLRSNLNHTNKRVKFLYFVSTDGITYQGMNPAAAAKK